MQNWQISSLDVSVAFLNAELSPEDLARGICCRPPKVFVDAGVCAEDEIWVIKKALYGLRQAPRAWGTHRDKALAELAFKATDGSELRLNQLRTDPCVWQLLRTDVQGTSVVGWVVTYVDDLLAISRSDFGVQVLTQVAAIWKCSDIDVLSVGKEITFLGLKITMVNQGIFVHQQHYITELLTKYDCLKVNPADTIMGSDEGALGGSAQDSTDPEYNYKLMLKEAQKRCGELLWLATRTRPDLCYTVQQMCTRAVGEPSRVVRMARRVYRWLRHTQDVGMLLPNETEIKLRSLDPEAIGVWAHWSEPLLTYTDASFAPHIMNDIPERDEIGKTMIEDEYGETVHRDTHQSRSIHAIFVVAQGVPVWWKTARQPFVTVSTAESELVAVTEGFVAGRSVEAFLAEAFTPPDQEQPEGIIPLGCDNKAAVQILERSGASGPVAWRTRHLRIRAAVVMEAIETGRAKCSHVPGTDMVADLGTKTLPAKTLERLMRLICMTSMAQLASGQDSEEPDWDPSAEAPWWNPGLYEVSLGVLYMFLIIVWTIRIGGHIPWMDWVVSWLDWIGQLEHTPGPWEYGSAYTPPGPNPNDLLLDFDGGQTPEVLLDRKLQWVHLHNVRRRQSGFPLVDIADFDEERACFAALHSRNVRREQDGLPALTIIDIRRELEFRRRARRDGLQPQEAMVPEPEPHDVFRTPVSSPHHWSPDGSAFYTPVRATYRSAVAFLGCLRMWAPPWFKDSPELEPEMEPEGSGGSSSSSGPAPPLVEAPTPFRTPHQRLRAPTPKSSAASPSAGSPGGHAPTPQRSQGSSEAAFWREIGEANDREDEEDRRAGRAPIEIRRVDGVLTRVRPGGPSPPEPGPPNAATALAIANTLRRRYPLSLGNYPLGPPAAAAAGSSGSGDPGPSQAVARPPLALPAPGEWNLGPLNNDTTVWLSRYGSRYHRFYDCKGLDNANSKTPIRYGQMVYQTPEGEQVKPLCGYCEERLRLQRR